MVAVVERGGFFLFCGNFFVDFVDFIGQFFFLARNPDPWWSITGCGLWPVACGRWPVACVLD